MKRVGIVVGLIGLLGCPPPPSTSGGKPTGTPTDPVKVCEEIGDVCVMGGAQLGVCNKSTAACPGPDPCFTCMPQH
jgi:hypothetical protein